MNIKDRKSFYANIRRKAKVKTSEGPLVDADGDVMVTSRCMSEQLNEFFACL